MRTGVAPVKAAWDAVSVPAQSGDPTCTPSGGNDFSLALSPAAGTVQPGGSTTATVATGVTSGSAQAVTLTASGAPNGVTVSLQPVSVQAGSSAVMTVAAATTAAAGTYSITVTGIGTATHGTTYSPVVGSGPGTGTCAAGTVYRAGDTVNHTGPSYRCLQGHQAQTGWEPPNVPALWQRI